MDKERTKMTSGSLIAATKVKGTSVYNLQGEKVGTVEDLMIDKVSGRVVYAVMSFGGLSRHRREIPSAAVVGAEVRRQ